MPAAIRLATLTDAGAIAVMSRDLIEAGLLWSWTVPRVQRSLADADTNVAVVDDRSGLAGFAIMKYREAEARLLLLAVRTSAQRRGLGSALLLWTEAVARAAGIGVVYLEARAANHAALAFYRAHGYCEVQTLAGYYGRHEGAVRLGKDLFAHA